MGDDSASSNAVDLRPSGDHAKDKVGEVIDKAAAKVEQAADTTKKVPDRK